MTEMDTRELAELTKRLFTRHSWSDELWAEFRARIRGKQKDATERAIRDHRAESRFNDPNIAAILAKLKTNEAQQERGPLPDWIEQERRAMGIPSDLPRREVVLERHRRLLEKCRETYQGSGDRHYLAVEGTRLAHDLSDAGCDAHERLEYRDWFLTQHKVCSQEENGT